MRDRAKNKKENNKQRKGDHGGRNRIPLLKMSQLNSRITFRLAVISGSSLSFAFPIGTQMFPPCVR